MIEVVAADWVHQGESHNCFFEGLRVRLVSEFKADYRSALGEKSSVGTVMRRKELGKF